MRTITLTYNIAELLRQGGRQREAVSYVRRVLAGLDDAGYGDTEKVPNAVSLLWLSLLELGEFAALDSSLREFIRDHEAVHGAARVPTAIAFFYGFGKLRLGELDSADVWIGRAARDTTQHQTTLVDFLPGALSQLRLDQGRVAEAREAIARLPDDRRSLRRPRRCCGARFATPEGDSAGASARRLEREPTLDRRTPGAHMVRAAARRRRASGGSPGRRARCRFAGPPARAGWQPSTRARAARSAPVGGRSCSAHERSALSETCPALGRPRRVRPSRSRTAMVKGTHGRGWPACSWTRSPGKLGRAGVSPSSASVCWRRSRAQKKWKSPGRLGVEIAVEPGTSLHPVAVHGAFGDAKGCGDLLLFHPAEEPALDDLPLARLELGEALVQREHTVGVELPYPHTVGQSGALPPSAAALGGLPVTGVVYQDPLTPGVARKWPGPRRPAPRRA